MEMEIGIDYFPEIRKYKSNRDKYGILGVSLTKDNNVIGGLSWRYAYFDFETEKMKIISSYDIKKLRRNVESQGLEWRITNMEKARETYKLNSKLLVRYENLKMEHCKDKRVAEHTISKCGVQYVYLNNHNPNNYWTYRDNKHPTITRRQLSDLEAEVKKKGYDWIVKDNGLYESIIETEKQE